MFNMQALLDEAITKNSQYKGGQRDNAKFSVSDAGGCYRARVYKRLGVEPTREIEIAGLRKMQAGTAGHEHIQYLLKLFLSETELETEHLKGHPDAVVKNGELSLLEIKTIEKWGMTHITNKGAKPEHKLQMFTYWSLLRKELLNLNSAVLSYVKREDFGCKDFYFNWSDEIQEKVDNEWNPLIRLWENKKLPACSCKEMYDGNGAKYCRYSTSDKECCDESLFKN
jgi:hypothetical protein